MKIRRTELAFQKEYDRLKTTHGEDNIEVRCFGYGKLLHARNGTTVNLDPRDIEDRGVYREGSHNSNSNIRNATVNTMIEKWPVASEPYRWLMGQDNAHLCNMLYAAVDRNYPVHKEECASIEEEIRDLLPFETGHLVTKLENNYVAAGADQEEAWFLLGFAMGKKRAK